jgi:energy-coupling factor transporter ATP-binding protein EcfA2
MMITAIHIENLRALDRLDLDLAPTGAPLDIAVLAGPNGCGKTSVLEACLWALRQDALVPRALPGQPFRIHLVLEQQGEHYEIERTPGQHRWRSAGQWSPMPAKGLPRELQIRPLYFSSWRSPALIGSVGLSTKGPTRATRTRQDPLARLKQHLVNLKGASAFGGNGAAVGPAAGAVFQQIEDLWRELYPAEHGRFEAVLVNGPGAAAEGEPDGVTDLRFDLVLKDRRRPDGVSVDDLSSGEIEALSMIGALIMARAGLDLVLVDEPELHLHPAWHRAILRVLRRAAAKAQIICATHSEHVLDAVYSHQRFTLLREPDPRLRLVSGVPAGS